MNNRWSSQWSGIASTGLFALVLLSGACGLLYEVVWHKYLSILLGSHARATALVLAIFLGGLSAGYAAFGYWSARRQWNLLKAYALVEFGLFAWAAIFPLLYKICLPLTAVLYSLLGLNSIWIDLLISILLMGVPTFLMGGTLPLLTQALSPDLKNASQWHARIYGFNTVGAGMGTLLAGYLLVPTLGLTGALWFGMAGNLIIGFTFYFGYARQWQPERTAQVAPKKGRAGKTAKSTKADSKRNFSFPWPTTNAQWLLLGVGFLSGFYVLTLEAALIRLMGLSTGSSNYTFTLVVSVFVFGLGIGALMVRKISGFKIAHLFWNQLGVAALLLALYVTGEYWPYWAHLARVGLRDITQNFYIYQLRLAFGFGALLILPVGLCGLTLPLCFHLLKQKKEDLGTSVGLLYGLNTIGSVMGALVGGYALFYLLNLDQIYKIAIGCSLISVALLVPLYLPKQKRLNWATGTAGALVLLIFVGLYFVPLYSKANYIQPFRNVSPINGVSFKGSEPFKKYLTRTTSHLHYEDGPNTSVGIGSSVYKNKEFARTILVNGKSDSNTHGDLFTTAMLGHIPGLLARRLDRAAVIGFGTGMTIGDLASYPEINNIDVMEISPAVIKNAHYFDKYNGDVSQNAKVKIHEMDAFRFLAGTQQNYDIIISEPSNLWVTGVENLYASEFYKIVKKRLNPEGMFVQWIHVYSSNSDLLRIVLRTMSDHFRNISLFQLSKGDLALVGWQYDMNDEDLKRAQKRLSQDTKLRMRLKAYGISRLETVLAREVVPPSLIKDLARGKQKHTLVRPVLGHEAAIASFAGSVAKVQEMRRNYDAFYSSVKDSLLAKHSKGRTPSQEVVKALRESFCNHSVSKIAYLCAESVAMAHSLDPNFRFETSHAGILAQRDIANIHAFHANRQNRFTETDLKETYVMLGAIRKHYSPIARFPVDRMVKRLDRCLKVAGRTNHIYGECLLQKVMLYQLVAGGTGAIYTETVDKFSNWFSQLSSSTKNYAKFQQANKILTHLY